MGNLSIIYRKISELKPYPRNARTHSRKQLKQIATAITEFGFTNAVLVDENNQIIAGHGRVQAAEQLGLTEVPTVQIAHLSATQKRAYILADNRLAEKAGWDHEILAVELQGLLADGFEVVLTGFEAPDIDVVLDAAANKKSDGHGDDNFPAPGPAVTQAGDLWLLGTHRIFCGNALDGVSYDNLLDGGKASLIFTDPPYNVAIDGNVANIGGRSQIQYRSFAMGCGEMTSPAFTSFLTTTYQHLVANSLDGSIHYICMDWRHMQEMLTAGYKVYAELKNVCIWNKSNGGMGSFYRSKHEHIFVWKSGTAAHVNNFELGQYGRYRTNVWDYAGVNTFGSERMDELQMHPTVKPVALVADAIKDCSKQGDVVLDPFCGSGTIIVAAERGRGNYEFMLVPGVATPEEWQREIDGRHEMADLREAIAAARATTGTLPNGSQIDALRESIAASQARGTLPTPTRRPVNRINKSSLKPDPTSEQPKGEVAPQMPAAQATPPRVQRSPTGTYRKVNRRPPASPKTVPDA